MPCIPPITRRPRKTVFPRKRSSGPPDGGLQCKASCGSFILSRDSPDSVISGPGPLMPERRIAPPLALLLYHASRRESNAETPPNARKKAPGSIFSKVVRFAGQVLWIPTHPRKKKTAPGTVSGCGMVLFSVPSVQVGRDPLISAEGIPEPGSAGPGTYSCTARRADRR